jgi:hypothetical protein
LSDDGEETPDDYEHCMCDLCSGRYCYREIEGGLCGLHFGMKP